MGQAGKNFIALKVVMIYLDSHLKLLDETNPLRIVSQKRLTSIPCYVRALSQLKMALFLGLWAASSEEMDKGNSLI